MNSYPYSSPIILTDALFVLYGGDGTLGTSKQRELAYWLSEKTVSQNPKTFLLPTTITGTFASPRATILLDHAYINSVSTVRFLDTEEKIYFTATGSNSSYFSLRDDVYGIVDLHCIVASCSVCSSNGVMIYTNGWWREARRRKCSGSMQKRWGKNSGGEDIQMRRGSGVPGTACMPG